MANPIEGLKLSSSHLQAIGEVASEWSALEFSFQCAMSMVSKVPFDTIVAFTAPSPMHIWIDILENLLQLKPLKPELLEKLRTLDKRIRKAQKDRNTIVHAVWSQQFALDLGKELLDACDMAYGVGFPKKIKDGLIKQFSYTSEQMQAVAKEIRDLADEFRSVFWEKEKAGD